MVHDRNHSRPGRAAVAAPVRERWTLWMLLTLMALFLIGWYWLGQNETAIDAASRSETTGVGSDATRASTGDGSLASATGDRDGSPIVARGPSPPIAIPAYAAPPAFPLEAVRRGESGKVILSVTVGVDGLPSTIAYVRHSGSDILDKAARDAVTKWRFQPAWRGGKAVAEVIQIPFDFEPAS